MTRDDSRDHREALLEYVRRGVARLEAGDEVDPAELCRERPELAASVAEALGLAEDVRTLQSARDGDALSGLVLQGRYRLDGRVGAGAMGVVYRAEDLELERTVAVKILPAELFRSEGRVQRFLREARALAALDHPAVVPVFDRGQTDQGVMFLVMGLLDGVSLAGLLSEGFQRCASPAAQGASTEWAREAMRSERPPPERTFVRLAARWTAELAAALAAAHRAGVLHRDLKPSNVFVTRDWRAVLLDFGLAKRESDPTLTSGQVLGTPCYMAPEQARGADAMGAATDVYGLGATLYHMLTQRPPFGGDAGLVLRAVLEDEPVPADRIHRGLPRDLEAIVEKSMERDPLRRYPTMEAMRDDLVAFLEGRPVTVRPLSAAARLGRRIRRRPARAAAVAATAVAAVAGIVAGGFWLAEQERLRQEEKLELMARLPSRLALEGSPGEREAVDHELRADALAKLDRIVALDPDDVAMRFLRAAVVLDRAAEGDHARAAADVAHAAEVAGTEYCREIAARYRDADRDRAGVLAVDLDGLAAAPSADDDHWIAAFHVLRRRAPEGYAELAAAHLDPILARHSHALGLRLNAQTVLLARARGRGQQLLQGQELCAMADRLENETGRPTARSRALAGMARMVMGQVDEAAPALRDAVELCPLEGQTWLNLGVVLHRRGVFDEALAALEQAARLQPHNWRPAWQRVLVLSDQGRFTEADAATHEAVLSAGAAHRLRGEIRLVEYCRLFREDGVARRELLEEAMLHFGEAGDVAATPEASSDEPFSVTLTKALLEDDRDVASRRLAEHIASSSSVDPYELVNLAALLPESLHPDTVAEMRTMLHRLANDLAGHAFYR